jgi:hypothetical protein
LAFKVVVHPDGQSGASRLTMPIIPARPNHPDSPLQPVLDYTTSPGFFLYMFLLSSPLFPCWFVGSAISTPLLLPSLSAFVLKIKGT